MSQSSHLRAVVRQVHLWMGLSVGALFALIALTGSVLVFYPAIDTALHAEVQDRGMAGPASYDAALMTLHRGFPDKTGPWRLEVTGAAGAIPARYYNPPETAGHAFAPMMVWLSADGQRVLRTDYWGRYAVTFIYDLHYRLLSGTIGAVVVGYLGLASFALLLSGLWVWWPRTSWRKALRFKRGAPPLRQLRDWHKLAGLIGALPLMMLALTGTMLALPDESAAVMTPMLGPVDGMPVIAPGAVASANRVTPSQAVRVAMRHFPRARTAWIEVPGASDCCYRIRMQQPGDPSDRFPHSFVWVDKVDGRLIATVNAATASPQTTVTNWIHPLHDGSFAGMGTRIATLLFGLVPVGLFVTGLWRWRLRRHRPTRTVSSAAARP